MEQYKEKLEEAKKLYESANDDQKHVLESLFPELKESEGERIRKEIISHLQFLGKYCQESMPNVNEWIAWLEKQSDNLVKNSYTNNKDYIRYADRYSYEIWRKLMDNFKNIKDYHIGCNEVSDIVLNAIIDTFNWLEKGGDKNKVSKHVEAINEEKVDDANKVEPKDYNSIDPHFGKPADKVEPKFNFSVGQWIVATGKCVYLITKIDGFNVTLVDVDGNEYVFDTSSLEDAHLWTIQDAKDGDVLFHSDSASNGIFIFKEIIDKGFAKEVICYCDYDSEDHFCLGEHHTCCWADAKILHPATKDQRDTLMKAMAYAGYTFDFEKKELKKIEQISAKWSNQEEIAEIPFGAKDSELQEATYFIPKGFHAEIDNDKVVIKKGEKPTAWSEEDEKRIFRIKLSLQKDMMAHKHSGCDIADLQNCEDWLMNLYESHRVQPQPKQEWSERDKEEFQIAIDTLVEAGQHDPAHWLKSLKQRIGG